MQKNILKMAGSQILKYNSSLIDCNILVWLRIANTKQCQLKEKRLKFIKVQNGHHVIDLVKVSIYLNNFDIH